LGGIWIFILIFAYLVTGAAHDGGEDGAGSVISGETGLAHAGAVVNDQSSNIVVTHVGCMFFSACKKDAKISSVKCVAINQQILRENLKFS
jgi:hypothetical protein